MSLGLWAACAAITVPIRMGLQSAYTVASELIMLRWITPVMDLGLKAVPSAWDLLGWMVWFTPPLALMVHRWISGFDVPFFSTFKQYGDPAVADALSHTPPKDPEWKEV